jgi:lipopolysaccharide/colanic/teichoic acid biosynthesis glycosyltransferase
VSPVKRAMDLLGAALGLAVASPLLLLIAVAIRLDDGGPVFFRQVRIGRGGLPFRIWKFRTMSSGNAGPALTVGHDRRITRIGSRLRRSRLDELPQLINVLTGQMSLVGPRPEVPEFVRGYDAEQRQVLNYRPGITDPASLQFRDEAALLASRDDPLAFYAQQVMPEKVRLSLAYARRATPLTDLGVILATIGVLSGSSWAPPSGRPGSADSASSEESSDAHDPEARSDGGLVRGALRRSTAGPLTGGGAGGRPGASGPRAG